jgi:Zn-finger nucleic acid-binding protein
MAAATMSCPKCDAPLGRVTTSHGVFWRCDGCRGTAIGLEALRRTFARDQINALWRRAREAQGSPAAACPSCRNQMIEVAATAQPEPRIEVCRICHFLWFDADELAAFAPLPPDSAPAETPLPPEARQALALAELDLIRRKADREERRVADEFWITLAHLFSTTIR